MQADKTWDRADFAGAAAWAEMDEFLKKCEADGPAATAEERQRICAQFLEIQQRCNAKVREIFERSVRGDPAPHLREV